MQQKLDSPSHNFGLRLRAHVERAGTIEAAHSSMKVSRATLFNWFKRQTPPPGKEKLEKLRLYLGENVDWILYGVQNDRGEMHSGNLRPPEFLGGHVSEPRAPYGVVASRYPIRRGPSTRADCEAYVAELFDRAEASANPNAFPALHEKLLEEFPLAKYAPVAGANEEHT